MVGYTSTPLSCHSEKGGAGVRKRAGGGDGDDDADSGR